MQNMGLTSGKEIDLILQIKQGDDTALKSLCYLYQPLINKVKRMYHVRYYDSQDWDQDALIICHASALRFDIKRGKFSSYYKTRLTNHAKSLVRYDTAYRRQALKQSVSLETASKNNLMPMNQSYIYMSEVPLSESFTVLITRLSKLEINALLVGLGITQQEEVLEKLQISNITLARARSRLAQKMRESLLE